MFFLLVLCSFSEQDLLSSTRDQLSKNQNLGKVISDLSQFLSNENILAKDKIEAYTLRSTAYFKIGKLEESLNDAEKASNDTLIKLAKNAKSWLNFAKSTKYKELFKINCYIKLINICPFSGDFILNLNHLINNNSAIYDDIISKEKNNLPQETISFIQLLHYFTTKYDSYISEFNESSNYENICQKIKEYYKYRVIFLESETDEDFNKCKQLLQDLLIPTDSPIYRQLIYKKYPNQLFIENYYTSQLSNNYTNEFYSILGLPIPKELSWILGNIEVTKRYNELVDALELKKGIDLNSDITKKILEFYQNHKEKIYDAYFVLDKIGPLYDHFVQNHFNIISYNKKLVNDDEIMYTLYTNDHICMSFKINLRTGVITQNTKVF